MNTTVTLLETNTELQVPEQFIINKGNLTSDHFYDAFHGVFSSPDENIPWYTNLYTTLT